MFIDIVNEFQKVTKFNIFDYFQRYSSFLKDEYPSINLYYAGKRETIDYGKLNKLDALITESRNVIRLFSTFSNKLSNCGFWELQEYCQNLLDTLEKITKLPKYNRVSKTKYGYKSYIQIDSSVGSFRTPEDLSLEINSRNVSSVDIILNNELGEHKWEIDEYYPNIKAYVDNNTTVVVPTILEEPVGKQIYGKDIKAKVGFEDNDVEIVKYEDNVEQKCNILLSIIRGSVPELPTFGRNNVGTNANMYGYVELIKDLNDIFAQDPLFLFVEITEIDFAEGSVNVTCNIKTKYSYATKKTLTL